MVSVIISLNRLNTVFKLDISNRKTVVIYIMYVVKFGAKEICGKKYKYRISYFTSFVI